jgi:hypothetical protein
VIFAMYVVSLCALFLNRVRERTNRWEMLGGWPVEMSNLAWISIHWPPAGKDAYKIKVIRKSLAMHHPAGN